MNLVEQIFEQAKLGTAQNPDANPFALGVQLGQHQQQINMQKQQLAQELAVAPLKRTLMEQEAAFKAAQTEQMLYANQTRVESEQAIGGLAGMLSKAASEAEPTDGLPLFLEAIAKNPRIIGDERVQRMWQDYNTSVNAKIALKESAANNFASPKAVLVPSAIPGNPPYEAVQTSKNGFTLPQSNVTTFTTPEGAVFEQRTGAGGAGASGAANGLGQAATTQMQEKLGDISRAAALLDESLKLISPETVGPRGKLNAAIEKGANILSPGSMGTPVTKAQQTFNATALAQYKSLKADSQINKLEAAGLKEIASVTDWWEAAATATEKYQTLRDLTGLQAVLMSHKLNRITPDDVLQGMSLDFVDKYRRQKTITDAEMGRWIDLHGGNDAVERMLMEQGK